MLAAIGVILISKQIPLALGYDKPDFWTSGFIQLLSARNFLGNIEEFKDHITLGAIFISSVSITILLLFQRPRIKRFFGILPAPLIVVVLGILINFLFQKFLPGMALNKNQLVTIPHNLFSSIQFPNFSSVIYQPNILKIAFEIALLASLETLLSIEAIDKLDNQNRLTPVNRELIAQGIGNMACGMLGAIPITAVIVRGSANVDAGARTKLSAFTHGVFLLLAVLSIPFIINMIPYACLASILLITGFNLAKPKLVKSMFKMGWKQFIPFIATIIVILLTDLLIGVAIGLLISMYYIIQNNLQEDFTITKKLEHYTEHFNIKLNSNVTFLNKVKLRNALDQIPEYSILTIDGTDCNFIDYDVLEIISEFEGKAHKKHIEVHLDGIDKVETVASAH
ncbi:MAG: SulP family inorganic anion transporter [Bacteroidota bacterium]|nr:SulP family inorganic anion transporter [Bacteroidota bacterium]